MSSEVKRTSGPPRQEQRLAAAMLIKYLPDDIINQLPKYIFLGRIKVIYNDILPSMIKYMERNDQIIKDSGMYMPKGDDGKRISEWIKSQKAQEALNHVTKIYPITLNERKQLLESLNKGEHSNLFVDRSSAAQSKKKKKKRRNTKKRRNIKKKRKSKKKSKSRRR